MDIMENTLHFSSNKLEIMILGYCCLNASFFLNIKPYLDTSKRKNVSYFQDEKNQRIFNIICKFFDKYKRFLVKETFKAIIEKLKDDEEMKFLLNSIIDRIYDFVIDDIDPEFIEHETKEFIKEAKSYEAILLAQIDIEERNFSNMLKRVEEATRINFDKYLGLSIKNVDESIERIKKLDEETKISTGFPSLDSLMDGGLHAKEMTVFSAIPGGYKCIRKDTIVKVKYLLDVETGEIL